MKEKNEEAAKFHLQLEAEKTEHVREKDKLIKDFQKHAEKLSTVATNRIEKLENELSAQISDMKAKDLLKNQTIEFLNSALEETEHKISL